MNVIARLEFELIGVTLLCFKMDVMQLVPETKMADVSILISLGNLSARRTTCLVLKSTSATSIFSWFFGAYSMTIIFYKYSYLPTLTLFFTISLGESTHSFQCDFQREHSHSLNFNEQSQHTVPPFYLWLPAVNRHKNGYFLQPFSSSLYFVGETFSSLEHRNFVKSQKETNSRNTSSTRIG